MEGLDDNNTIKKTLTLISSVVHEYQCNQSHTARAPGACGVVAADMLAYLHRLRFEKILPIEYQFQAMTGVLTSSVVDELVLTNQQRPPNVEIMESSVSKYPTISLGFGRVLDIALPQLRVISIMLCF
jgi:hypothetical protein